ncbi:MAG: hypothetical protein KIT87_22370, partial [Anaerolineae bacterium]|nr:hypothetical protein [Anaerolineae bacterium]
MRKVALLGAVLLLVAVALIACGGPSGTPTASQPAAQPNAAAPAQPAQPTAEVKAQPQQPAPAAKPAGGGKTITIG